MKKVFFMIVLFCLGFSLGRCEAPDSVKDASCSNIAQVYGDWDVEFFVGIGQPATQTTMKLEGDGNGVRDSNFSGFQFEDSEITIAPGYFVFSAQTSDTSGSFIHAARYNCSTYEIDGQTWSRGQKSLTSWKAKL